VLREPYSVPATSSESPEFVIADPFVVESIVRYVAMPPPDTTRVVELIPEIVAESPTYPTTSPEHTMLRVTDSGDITLVRGAIPVDSGVGMNAAA
jgi:hypothetical protein